jgi:hypothetical protein
MFVIIPKQVYIQTSGGKMRETRPDPNTQLHLTFYVAHQNAGELRR